jgi:hypothetical protein
MDFRFFARSCSSLAAIVFVLGALATAALVMRVIPTS